MHCPSNIESRLQDTKRLKETKIKDGRDTSRSDNKLNSHRMTFQQWTQLSLQNSKTCICIPETTTSGASQSYCLIFQETEEWMGTETTPWRACLGISKWEQPKWTRKVNLDYFQTNSWWSVQTQEDFSNYRHKLLVKLRPILQQKQPSKYILAWHILTCSALLSSSKLYQGQLQYFQKIISKVITGVRIK